MKGPESPENRDLAKINWRLDRKAARRKFGSSRNSFTRSKTWFTQCERF
jgi:hypothetical protein